MASERVSGVMKRNSRRVFIGQSNQANSVSQDDLLKSVDVPVIDADCRFCPDPCDQDHDDFAKMSIDMESDLLGSVKPYRRQVSPASIHDLWVDRLTTRQGCHFDRKIRLASEVTEADGTLAAFLCSANERHCTSSDSTGKASSAPNDNKPLPPGLFTQDTSNRLSILNGSHHSLSLHHDPASTLETVIILPDYKVVTDVPRSLEGAETLWKSALDPAYGRSGAPERSDTLKSWVLPYSCLILLCSHKRRDKRCAIAAPVLEKKREGWEVHTDLEDLSSKPTLEPYLVSRLFPGQHRALILRNSHIGGHKFAGNVIIYTPTGASVWYGRVTSHHVESIVANTIIDGRVLSPILRGGLNIARPGCRTVYDW
ncbi:Sucrase/ferredoxin-like-domain-containing protein [Pisolithus thermaeus]|nr:Sucrase/ferredoxin-like-domain-containing protein [Pisolithus thermaeus]